ncbi:MAG: hypothetical protein IKQ16_01990 [Lentisphaeria bacterium]|nr:hypothetical protein [Lentisphaeria bacterium]
MFKIPCFRKNANAKPQKSLKNQAETGTGKKRKPCISEAARRIIDKLSKTCGGDALPSAANAANKEPKPSSSAERKYGIKKRPSD